MADTSNNWLFSREDLLNSPSRKDGISWENEKAIRHNSCSFILEIGKYLRRGKTDNTAYIRDSAACIIFHRFFTAQSFKSQNRLVKTFHMMFYFLLIHNFSSDCWSGMLIPCRKDRRMFSKSLGDCANLL